MARQDVLNILFTNEPQPPPLSDEQLDEQISITTKHLEHLRNQLEKKITYKLSRNGVYLACNDKIIARNYESVLKILNHLETKGIFLHIQHYDHNRFSIHSGKSPYYWSSTHKCSIENAISYVTLRQNEQKTPHIIFNKIGRILRITLLKLDIASQKKIIGIFPSATMTTIGIVQTIIGIALSIFFAMPALFSKNAKIILRRSFRHAYLGPTNIAVGVANVLCSTILFWI